MARAATVPTLTVKPGLTHYLEEIRQLPMLERQENAASLGMLAAANRRWAPSSRSLGAVYDGHERSEFGSMQMS